MASECGEAEEYPSSHSKKRNPKYSLHVYNVLASHHRKEASKEPENFHSCLEKQNQTNKQTPHRFLVKGGPVGVACGSVQLALPDSTPLYDFNISNLSPAGSSGYWPRFWGKIDAQSVFLSELSLSPRIPL